MRRLSFLSLLVIAWAVDAIKEVEAKEAEVSQFVRARLKDISTEWEARND